MTTQRSPCPRISHPDQVQSPEPCSERLPDLQLSAGVKAGGGIPHPLGVVDATNHDGFTLQSAESGGGGLARGPANVKGLRKPALHPLPNTGQGHREQRKSGVEKICTAQWLFVVVLALFSDVGLCSLNLVSSALLVSLPAVATSRSATCCSAMPR